MALIGYARVSTTEQELAAQRSALTAAGCVEIVEETASGADPARPELARLLVRIRPGDTLVVIPSLRRISCSPARRHEIPPSARTLAPVRDDKGRADSRVYPELAEWVRDDKGWCSPAPVRDDN